MTTRRQDQRAEHRGSLAARTPRRVFVPCCSCWSGRSMNGIIVGTLYGIIALGVTLTFGITGIVNFALGEFMMLGAYFVLVFDRWRGIAFPLAVVPAVAAAGAGRASLADQTLFRFTRNNLVNGLAGFHRPDLGDRGGRDDAVDRDAEGHGYRALGLAAAWVRSACRA